MSPEGSPAGPTAVITGASRGLGRVSAVEMVRRGWHVIAAMRRPDRDGPELVDEVSNYAGRLELLALDLVNLDSIETAASQLIVRRIDALVHIAGLAPAAAFEDTAPVERVSTVQINLLGPMHLTALLLPAMRAHRSGKIVAVTSAAGRIGLPMSSVYGATKAALTCWIESLAAEVHQFGLSAHVLEAGMFDTEMVMSTEVPQAVGPYGDMYAAFANRRSSVVARAKPPSQFARKLAATLERPSPPVTQVVGMDARFAYFAQRFVPARLISALVRRLATPRPHPAR